MSLYSIFLYIVGLDAAGKTTILYKLKLGEIVTTIPTIGKFVKGERGGRVSVCVCVCVKENDNENGILDSKKTMLRLKEREREKLIKYINECMALLQAST